MSEDLDFDLWIPRPTSPGTFAKEVLDRVPRYGFRFRSLFHRNANGDDEVASPDPSGESPAETDFQTALSVLERRGWGEVYFGFELENGETWNLIVYVGPRPAWKLPAEEGRDLQWTDKPYQFVRRTEVEGARWWLVSISTTHASSLSLQMAHFLDSRLIPICRWLRPVIAFGDIFDTGSLHLPTTVELDQGAPAKVCWFNYYREEVATRLAIRSKLAEVPESSEARGQVFDDGDALLIVSPFPYGSDSGEREHWGEVLGLGSSSTAE